MENNDYKEIAFNAACSLNNALNDAKYLLSIPKEQQDELLTLDVFEEYEALANLCEQYIRNFYYYASIKRPDLLDAIDAAPITLTAEDYKKMGVK